MKRIFLVGSPRSGTTLLQSLIGCSQDVITFKESHLFSRSFSLRHPALPPHRSPEAEVVRFFTENGISMERLPPRMNIWARQNRTAVAAYYLAALDRAGDADGKTAWLEKTPRHLLFTDLIEQAAARDGKQITFIHLIRDGVSVAASISAASQLWQKPYDPISALRRWETEIAITREKSARENHVVVVYEDLLREPRTVMLKLARRLGIHISLQNLERRNEVMAEIVRHDESWKLDTAGQEIGRLGRTTQHISEEERARLKARIDDSDYTYLVNLTHAVNEEQTT